MVEEYYRPGDIRLSAIEEWYSYSIYHFTREQNIWTLWNSKSFDKGDWPVRPSKFMTDEYDKQSKKWIKVVKMGPTSAGKLLGKRLIQTKAHFEDAKIIRGEIYRRLKFTKVDGKLLKAQILGGVTEYEEMEYESKIALDFISLWDFRKRPRYYVFKKNRLYYRDKRRIRIKAKRS